MTRAALLLSAGLCLAGCTPPAPHGPVETLPFSDDPAPAVARLEIVNNGMGTRRKSLPADEAAILARTLLGEAAHRPDAEVRAIIGVVRNRLARGSYGLTVTDVVLHRRGGVYAFSCFDPARAPWDNVWADHLPRSREYARMLALIDDAWQQPLVSTFTQYYHPDAMKPRGRVPAWARGKTGVRIGAAIFF